MVDFLGQFTILNVVDKMVDKINKSLFKQPHTSHTKRPLKDRNLLYRFTTDIEHIYMYQRSNSYNNNYLQQWREANSGH